MDHGLYTQWPPQSVPESPHPHESRPSTLVDDWTKDRTTSATQSGGAASPLSAPTGGLDIDFTLTDIGASIAFSNVLLIIIVTRFTAVDICPQFVHYVVFLAVSAPELLPFFLPDNGLWLDVADAKSGSLVQLLQPEWRDGDHFNCSLFITSTAAAAVTRPRSAI